jgi:hypothetical protein
VIFQGTYDPRPQVDLVAQYEQKDYMKKRLETHQFDSNGNFGTPFIYSSVCIFCDHIVTNAT